MSDKPVPEKDPRNGRNSVVDSGLATERTFLAWQRTAIALVAASGLVTRFMAPTVEGPGPILVGLSGIVLGVAALIWLRLRYRRAHRDQSETGTLGNRGAGPLALISASTVVLAVLVALLPLMRGS